jgi:oligopeptide transport system substrate-binding protein
LKSLIKILVATSAVILFVLAIAPNSFAQEIASKSHLTTETFRLHLNSEPTTLSPFLQKNSNAGYLMQNVFGTLVKVNHGRIEPGLASCKYKDSKLIECKIKPEAKYADGSKILAEDFARTLNAFADPKVKALRADLVEPIEKVISKSDKLTLQLKRADSEFIFNLASTLLIPLKKLEFPAIENFNEMPFSGAYKINKWEKKNSIVLTGPGHPNIELLFVGEDTVALQMYESGQLDFLRRLPTLFIPKFKSRKDYFAIPQFRFDYIGFSGSLKSNKELRKALSESIDYKEFQELYFARPRPGCPGIPDSLFSKKPCLNSTKMNKKFQDQPTLDFSFSRQGGDDHKRTAEWLQSQWLSKLGIQVNIHQLDNKVFVNQLEAGQMTIFRKGLAPERPTCLAVLENFLPGSLENYLDIHDDRFVKTVTAMQTAHESKKKILCTKAVTWLLDQYLMIPTGPIDFIILVQPKWTGWHLNELNQLDLSRLKISSTKNSKL